MSLIPDRGIWTYTDGTTSQGFCDPNKIKLKVDFSKYTYEEIREMWATEITWYKDGRPHKEDGPAIIGPEKNGTRTYCWFLYGKRHREDGPAVVYSNGKEEYWIDDEKIKLEIMEAIQNETSKEKLAFYLTSTSVAERWLASKRLQELK